MKKHTKFFAMLLVLSMMVMALSACGSGTSAAEPSTQEIGAPETTEAVQETTVAEPEPADAEAPEEAAVEESVEGPEETPEPVVIELPIVEEPVTYSMWTTLHPAYMMYVTDLADLLVWSTISERTGINFDFTAVSGITASDSFNLMMAGADYTDIITEMDLFSDGIDAAIEQDILVDVAGEVEEYAPTYWDMVKSDPTAYLTLVTDSGAVGTIAALRGDTISTDMNGIMIRGDWLKEFDMDDPDTMEDIHAYLTTAKETNGAVSQFSADGLDGTILTSFNLDGNSGYIVKDGTVSSIYQENSFRDYLETARDWYKEGLIDPDFYSIDDITENASKVANGQYSMCSNSAQGISRITQFVSDPDSTIELYPVAYISANGEEIHVGQTSPLITDKDCWAFTTACDDVVPLVKLVEYMYSDEGYLLYNYGVEGETYTLADDGTPEWTDMMVNNPDYAFDIMEYLYATATIPGARDYSREAFNFSENELRCMEVYGNMTDGAYNYPTYAVMTGDESTKYSALSSDLETYTESAILAFITGQEELNDSSYNDFISTVQNMGIEEMVAIKQAAYDRAQEKYDNMQ